MPNLEYNVSYEENRRGLPNLFRNLVSQYDLLFHGPESKGSVTVSKREGCDAYIRDSADAKESKIKGLRAIRSVKGRLISATRRKITLNLEGKVYCIERAI